MPDHAGELRGEAGWGRGGEAPGNVCGAEKHSAGRGIGD